MGNRPIDAMIQRMEQLQSTPEYQENCRHLLLKCEHLETVFQAFRTNKGELQLHCQENTVRTEYAVGSTLHPGFYCPSPTFDIIVGNVKRGKLLSSRPTCQQPSHEYGFDVNDRLLYCNTLRNNSVGHDGVPAIQ